MKQFFTPNLSARGRLVRAAGAAALLIGSLFAVRVGWWLTLVLLSSGVFVAIEALRGWCVLRACGIKTKI